MKVADFINRYFELLLGLLLVLVLTPLFIKFAYMCTSLGFILYWGAMAVITLIIGVCLIVYYFIDL